MDTTNILSISAVVISVAGSVFAVLNHKRCRSRCGQTEIVASIDVENTTPAEKPAMNTDG